MHTFAPDDRRPQAIGPARSALFATKLFLQEALKCRVTRVWLPGLYCPKVAGALKRLGLRLTYYDLDSDLTPLVSSETSPRAVSPRRRDLVIGFYPFGLTRRLPAQFLNGRNFVLDACHALRTVLGGAPKDLRAPVIVSLRKEFGGTGQAWLLPQPEVSACGSASEVWSPGQLSAEAAQGRVATRMAVDALGRQLPSVGTSDVLTHLPLLASDRDEAIATLRSKGIDAWFWQRPLPQWSTDTVPCAASLKKSLLLVPAPLREKETEHVLNILQKFDFCPWR
ncbi:hypothetical protein [Roseibium aggregatum]|uniref:hypothetical protein n=1 Tax=Roseibium aggregatum TaxID=187304 RepID=UPI0025AD3B3C|nr:hypothetical protein [Roseibium aggregatum]WJS05544.1 hypothetical protein QUB73_26760 [Roseibium aggregatum]